MVIVKVGAGGTVSLFNYAGATDVVVDVMGWFPETGSFTGLTPARLLDTRSGHPTIDGSAAGEGSVGPNAVRELTVVGRGGVPASGVGSVVVNVAVTNPTDSSFLTVYPAGSDRPLAANLNFVAGQTVAEHGDRQGRRRRQDLDLQPGGLRRRRRRRDGLVPGGRRLQRARARAPHGHAAGRHADHTDHAGPASAHPPDGPDPHPHPPRHRHRHRHRRRRLRPPRRPPRRHRTIRWPGRSAASTCRCMPRNDTPVIGTNEIFDIEVSGTSVFVLGTFTSVRDSSNNPAAPDTAPIGQRWLVKYDMETGLLDRGFDPQFDDELHDMALSPDGTTLYVVGEFDVVDGLVRATRSSSCPR